MSRKVGKLSTAEERFIIDNHATMSQGDIALKINRTESLVEKYLFDKGLYIEKSTDQLKEENRLKMKLHNLAYWSSIISACTKEEINYFENNWLSFVRQMNEDVSWSEELFIKDWVLFEIQKNRLLGDQKETRDKIEQLKIYIDKEKKKLEKNFDPILLEKIKFLETELYSKQSSNGQIITSLEKINKDQKDVASKLQLNRKERREVETSADTYWGYIALLENEQFRDEESYKAEIGRIAQQKARNDLYSLHQYIDGTVDRCILNSESIKLDEEENNEA